MYLAFFVSMNLRTAIATNVDIYAIIIIGMMAFVLIVVKLANMTGIREYVGSVGWKK